MAPTDPAARFLRVVIDDAVGERHRSSLVDGLAALWAVVATLGGDGPSSAAGSAEPEPRIMVINSVGEARSLFRSSRHEADSKRRRVEQELASQTVEEFCDRYRIPRAFATREPAGW